MVFLSPGIKSLTYGPAKAAAAAVFLSLPSDAGAVWDRRRQARSARGRGVGILFISNRNIHTRAGADHSGVSIPPGLTGVSVYASGAAEEAHGEKEATIITKVFDPLEGDGKVVVYYNVVRLQIHT